MYSTACPLKRHTVGVISLSYYKFDASLASFTAFSHKQYLMTTFLKSWLIALSKCASQLIKRLSLCERPGGGVGYTQGNSTQLQLETQARDKCHRCVFSPKTITSQSSKGNGCSSDHELNSVCPSCSAPYVRSRIQCGDSRHKRYFRNTS